MWNFRSVSYFCFVLLDCQLQPQLGFFQRKGCDENDITACLNLNQTLQKTEVELEPMDRNNIDIAFRKELRRRIADLHESVCETQKIIKESSKAGNGWVVGKKTQGKVESRSKKQGISNHTNASKKND